MPDSGNSPPSDSSSTVFETEFSGGERPSHAIVRGLAVAEGKELLEVEPLANSIDPGALDAVLENAVGRRAEAKVIVEFCTASHQVTVDDGGGITIRECQESE